MSASESAAAPAAPIWFNCKLQRGEEGQGCSWRDRAAGTEQGARNLLERRQRRVALERLRERSGAHVADLIEPLAERGEEGQDARGEIGPPAQSQARATYLSSVSVALLLSASESAAAPAWPILLPSRLQRGEEGQACSWRDGAAGKEQGARDLLGTRVADLIIRQAAARRGGSGRLVARH